VVAGPVFPKKLPVDCPPLEVLFPPPKILPVAGDPAGVVVPKAFPLPPPPKPLNAGFDAGVEELPPPVACLSPAVFVFPNADPPELTPKLNMGAFVALLVPPLVDDDESLEGNVNGDAVGLAARGAAAVFDPAAGPVDGTGGLFEKPKLNLGGPLALDEGAGGGPCGVSVWVLGFPNVKDDDPVVAFDARGLEEGFAPPALSENAPILDNNDPPPWPACCSGFFCSPPNIGVDAESWALLVPHD
jgi:hypothetical protein